MNKERARNLMSGFDVLGIQQTGTVAHANEFRETGFPLEKRRPPEIRASSHSRSTKIFLQTGSMRTARYKHTAGLLPDGKVLIAGGSDDRDWQGLTNSAEIYDPDTEKFAATPPLNDKRFKLPLDSVQLPKGRILVAGGSKLTMETRKASFLQQVR